MLDFLSKCGDLIASVFKGIAGFVNFILGLPKFLISMIYVVPRPFSDIILAFISIISFFLLLRALGKIVSAYKGG